MKYVNSAFAILAFAFSSPVYASVVNCFEREWIIATPSDTPARLTIDQLSQAIQVQVPVLSVKSRITNGLVVEYKKLNDDLSQDKAKLSQAFESLSAMGFYVECNSTMEPFPSMTGRN